MLEPKTRAVDPVVLMESLFRLTELEIRFGLNMNVLSAGQIPAVLALRDVLKHWLEHRQEVLVRRTEHRLEKIEHRLEVLDGYLIAYLNLDEVIRIVRYEDEPKASADGGLQAHRRAGRGDPEPAAAVAVAARGDGDQGRARQALRRERRISKQLLASDDLQWARIAERGQADVARRWSKKTELGRRRTAIRRCARRSTSTSTRR